MTVFHKFQKNLNDFLRILILEDNNQMLYDNFVVLIEIEFAKQRF